MVKAVCEEGGKCGDESGIEDGTENGSEVGVRMVISQGRIIDFELFEQFAWCQIDRQT